MVSNFYRNKIRMALLATVVGSVATTNIHAAPILEEVFVTATKRSESLQDVPISLLAVDGTAIRESAITKMEDLTSSLPAVTVAANPVGNFIFIRGIGSSTNQGIEQSVSMFHDGVYMGRHQLSRAPFMDLERVEVLRGPQSIMFGKNTIGGALSVITAKPRFDESEGMISVLMGEDGEQEVNLVASGPLTDTLAARLAIRDYQYDGYMTNIMTGKDTPANDDRTIRLVLAYEPSDDLRINLKYETSEFKSQGRYQQIVITNPLTELSAGLTQMSAGVLAAATGGLTEKPGFDNQLTAVNDGGAVLSMILPQYAAAGYPDLDELSDNNMDVTTLTIDKDFGEYTVTSITGYAQYDYRDICDCDFSPLPLSQVDAAEDYEQISQELRLTSPLGGAFEFIAGLYYHKTDLVFSSAESFGAAIATPAAMIAATGGQLIPNLTRDYVFDQEQEQMSVFGSATYNLSDTSRVTVGLRYTDETKDVSHVLNKRMAADWDATRINVSAIDGSWAGPVSFGTTAEEYDRLDLYYVPGALAEVPYPGIPMSKFLDGAVWEGLLGTFEHNVVRSRSEDYVDWSVNFEHDLNSDTLVYASASTGVKGGGFDARYLKNPDDPNKTTGYDKFEYNQEEALNFEIGMKATLLDGSMNFNVAAFHTNIEDLQVSIFDGRTSFMVDNAAEMTVKGVEFDLTWAVTDNLKIKSAGAWLDNAYDKFDNSPCWAWDTVDVGGSCYQDAVTDADGTYHPAGRDAAGSPNIFSPEISYNLVLDYSRMVTDGLELRAMLEWFHSDDIFSAADLDPIYAYQPSYDVYNMRLGIGDVDGRWDVALIGKNLSNEVYSYNNNDQALMTGNGFGSMQRMRSWAVQGTYNF